MSKNISEHVKIIIVVCRIRQTQPLWIIDNNITVQRFYQIHLKLNTYECEFIVTTLTAEVYLNVNNYSNISIFKLAPSLKTVYVFSLTLKYYPSRYLVIVINTRCDNYRSVNHFSRFFIFKLILHWIMTTIIFSFWN